MKATAWGWRPVRPEGIWKHGCRWAQPLTVAAPWIALALLFVEFAFIERRLVAAPGLVLNLPAPVCGEAATPGLAAIVVPVVREGIAEAFRERLAARAQADRSGTLLLLADGRVASGDLMRLMGLAREAGVTRVQIGERRE